MLTYNTMRFGTDEFTPYIKWGLLVSKDLALDMTDYNFIERFNIAGAEPVGTKRRFMFKVDDKVYTFDGQDLEEYTGEVNVDNVLAYGNTAAQVEAVRNFRKWAGKKIYPIIALYTEVEDSPSVKLSANFVSGDEVLDYEKTHDVLGGGGLNKILGFEYEPEITGDASAKLTVAYNEQDLVSGDWSDFMELDDVIGKTVGRIRLKNKLHVGSVNGTNSAKIGKVKIFYTDDTTSVVCGETAELYTIRKNYYLPLKTCAVILKHAALTNGASFDVYYHATSAIKEVILQALGVGTGSSQTFTLSTKKYFRAYSFHLFIDGTETTDFTFNTGNNTITVTATRGAGISATYAYSIQPETWIKMTPDPTQRDISDGKQATRYFAAIEDSTAKYGVVKIVFNRPLEGNPSTVTREATGALQQYKCPYTPDNIECTAEDWEFDESTNIISFTSPTGETVTIKYSQQAPNPTLYSFTVGWSV